MKNMMIATALVLAAMVAMAKDAKKDAHAALAATTTTAAAKQSKEQKQASEFLVTKKYAVDKVKSIEIEGKDGAFVAMTTDGELCKGNYIKSTLNCAKKGSQPAMPHGDSD